MSQKRIRSLNWDEEEKQLFRSVLREYSKVIENKSLDTNTNKLKTKAWEEVHKKFNELNSRKRELSQLKIQWKTMKITARKTYSSFKNEINKTGGGGRPTSPNDVVIEIKDLMNPAELLRDQNIYDSDGIIPSSSENEVVLATPNETHAIITLQDSIEDFDNKVLGGNNNDNLMNVDDQKIDIPQENIIMATPIVSKTMGTNLAKKVPKRKIFERENSLKSRKDHDEYVQSMLSHSKMLKDEEHMRHMEMAEEEHKIKMEINKEKLKCAILEREILEFKLSEMKK